MRKEDKPKSGPECKHDCYLITLKLGDKRKYSWQDQRTSCYCAYDKEPDFTYYHLKLHKVDGAADDDARMQRTYYHYCNQILYYEHTYDESCRLTLDLAHVL